MIFSWLEDVVRLRGSALAVVQRDTYLSFRGLLHRANRRASELRAIGVEPGDAVGIMLGNVADYVVLTVAVNQLGATLVPVPPLCSGAELDAIQGLVPLRAILTRPGAKVLDRKDSERADHSPAPTGRSRLQGSLLSCARFPRLAAMGPDAPVMFVTPTADSGYRTVTFSAAQLATQAENLALWLSISDADRIGMCLPLSDPFGFLLGVTMTLGYGAQLHLDDDLSARRTMQRIREAELTCVAVSRATVQAFCELPSARPFKGAPVRLLCAEGAVGRELSQAFHKHYKARVQGAYHRADTGLLALDPDGKSPHTVGRPVAGVRIRITAPDGKEVTVGRRGRLLVKGSGVAQGGPPPASTPKGWRDTGERGALDKQGRLKLFERPDDLRSVEGQLLSLEEVRQALLAHDAVQDAAVTLGDVQGGTAPGKNVALVAEVVIRRKVSPERLAGHCASRLSLHKVPEQIRLVDSLD